MSKYNFAFEAKFIKSETALTNSSVPLENSLGATVKEMPHCLLNTSKAYERGKHSTLCFILIPSTIRKWYPKTNHSLFQTSDSFLPLSQLLNYHLFSF